MIARMWEVRASASGFDELLTWVCDVAVPRIEVLPQHVASEVFSSTDRRIVTQRDAPTWTDAGQPGGAVVTAVGGGFGRSVEVW